MQRESLDHIYEKAIIIHIDLADSILILKRIKINIKKN